MTNENYKYIISKVDIDKLNAMFVVMQTFIDKTAIFSLDVEKLANQSKSYIESLRIAVDALHKYARKYEDKTAEKAVKKINKILEEK